MIQYYKDNLMLEIFPFLKINKEKYTEYTCIDYLLVSSKKRRNKIKKIKRVTRIIITILYTISIIPALPFIIFASLLGYKLDWK